MTPEMQQIKRLKELLQFRINDIIDWKVKCGILEQQKKELEQKLKDINGFNYVVNTPQLEKL